MRANQLSDDGAARALEGDEPPRADRSELRLAIVAMVKDRLAVAGVAVLLIMIALAVAAPVVSPYAPDVADRHAGRLAPPLTAGHVLGTDGQARDVLSRLIWGGRVSLPIAAIPIVISSVIGLLLGLPAGYFGGPFAAIVMRSLDVVFAFPGVLASCSRSPWPRSWGPA